jgi:hypothetical protein
VTPEETQKFEDLCVQIIAEKNKGRYTELVRQLDEIMDAKEQRLHDEPDNAVPERGRVS